MPDNPVNADARVHVAVKDVHVSAADADKGDIHRNLARSRLAVCNGFDGEVPASAIEGCVLGHLGAFQVMVKGARRGQSKLTPVPGVSGAMQCNPSRTRGRVV